LTRSIQELERELGVPLFERHPTGVAVTEMGALFVRRANAVRTELRRARDELDQVRGKTHGRLSVCLATVPHIALLPYALPAFRARYPEVHLDLREALFPTIEAPLRAGIVDFYIGPPPAEDPGHDLLVEKLFSNTRVILGRKGHPLAHARSLRDLIDAQWLSTSVFVKAEDELGPLFAEHGLPAPRLVVQGHSALTMLVTIGYTDLLGMLPVQWTEFPLTRDSLQRIDVVEPLPAPPICIVRRAGLPLTPAGEYFCDMLRRASAHVKSPGAVPATSAPVKRPKAARATR
jgi:DNA-binding transcriptional LysR family regulator